MPGFRKKLVAALFIFAALAGAQVPNLISYQGKIAKEGLTQDGTFTLTFALYNVQENGNALWNEVQQVTTYYGVFSVLLGSVTPFPAALFEQSNLFLGISIDGEAEMLPRSRIVSAAFAFHAAMADSLKSYSITGSKIVDGSIASLDLADESVTTVKLAPSSITVDKVAPGQLVKSINGLADQVFLQPGNNITITPDGNKLTISASSSGGASGGVNGSGSVGQTAVWAGSNTLAGSNDIMLKNAQIGLGTSNPYNYWGASKPKVDVNGYLIASNHFKRQISAYRWADVSSNVAGQAVFGTNIYTATDSTDQAKVIFRYGQTHATIGAAGISTNYPTWDTAISFIAGDSSKTDHDQSFTPKVLAVMQRDGKFGIGTTLPSEKLEVAGIVYSKTGGFKFPDGTIQTSAAIGTAGLTGSGRQGQLAIWSNTNSLSGVDDIVYMNSRIGIGTTNPQYKLDVVGSASIINNEGRQLNTTYWADVSANSTGYGLFAGNAFVSYLSGDKWKYANTSKLIGAVGIATHYPSYNKLSIIASPDSFSTKDQTFQPTVIATFTRNGKVGIGTTAPVEILDVSGAVRATSFRARYNLGQDSTPAIGGCYADNVVYAWASVNSSGLELKGMGCTVLRNDVGTYSIVLKLPMIQNGIAPAVTAQMFDNFPVIAAIKEINSTGFKIQLFKIANGSATLVDAPFYFNIVGRAY